VLLEVEGSPSRYRRGSTLANDRVNLMVEAGQVYGLLATTAPADDPGKPDRRADPAGPGLYPD